MEVNGEPHTRATERLGKEPFRRSLNKGVVEPMS